DIPHLTNWGTPLLLGPGSIHDAHTANERVGKRELAEAVTSYERLARILLTNTNQEAHKKKAEGAGET
ncbi:MAG TPA: hypothetical protein VFH31_17100, partial [Pyrinomonadaceae bacterium]|nr:hypothetical protein [Pyrinomonadaceae bacterium]